MQYGIFLRNGKVDIVEMNDYDYMNDHNYAGMCVEKFYIHFNEDTDSYEKYDEVRKDVVIYAQKLSMNGGIPLSDDAKEFINSIST